MAEFGQFVGGICEDAPPPGVYCAIQDRETCELAAALLGLADQTTGAEIASDTKVRGCYLMSSTDNLKFNSLSNSSGVAGDDTNVCTTLCEDEVDAAPVFARRGSLAGALLAVGVGVAAACGGLLD